MKFVIWEGKGGTRPLRNVPMTEIEISGSMFSSLLPENSKIEITMKMDESRIVKFNAYFPYLDETIEKVTNPDYKVTTISAEELSVQLQNENLRLKNLRETFIDNDLEETESVAEIANDFSKLEDQIDKGRGDTDRHKEVHKMLNELSSKLDEIDRDLKWPQQESELNIELERTTEIVERYGNNQDETILSQISPQVEKVIAQKNSRRATDIIEKLQELFYKILFDQPGYWVSVLHNINESFNEIQWSAQDKARILLDKGIDLLSTGQYSDEIRTIVVELWDLMPEPDKEKTKVPRTDIPHYQK